MCERLDEDIAAALTQSAVVLTFLAGLREEGHPDLGHRVTTGLLPEDTGSKKTCMLRPGMLPNTASTLYVPFKGMIAFTS